VPTNPYFRNYSSVTSQEQALLEDNIVELIQMHGHDVYYIVRESETEEDPIMGEDPRAKYTRVYLMEMYPESTFSGSDFMSKFGLQIPDTQVFRVARKTFERYVPAENAVRPREGDLIYMPVQKKLYEITFVEDDDHFAALGRTAPYLYKINADMFRYSHQKITTGVPEVDQVDDDNAYGVVLNLNNGSGNFIYSEEVYQGPNLAYYTAKAVVRDWSPADRVLDVIYINGTFVTGSNVKGATSGSDYDYLATLNPLLDDRVPHDEVPNAEFESQANASIVRTETNPFGRA
jgi:hypothetical protein